MKYKYTQGEILDKLPNSWSDIKFKTYLELMKVKVDGSEDPLEVIKTNIDICSLFLGLPANIIEQFPMSVIKAMNEKLSFLSERCKPVDKSKFVWKHQLMEPTYDDFITFVKVSEQLNAGDMSNFPLLIKVVIKSEVTDEQILDLPMDEVEYGFFLLRKFSMKYLQHTMKDLTAKMIMLRTNEMMDQMAQIQGIQFKKRLRVLKEKFKEHMDSISLLKKRPNFQVVTTSPLWKSRL